MHTDRAAAVLVHALHLHSVQVYVHLVLSLNTWVEESDRPVVARPVDYNIPPENSLDSSRGGRSLCPIATCNGIGYVSTQNTELTALIPYKDERLKPRRTKLYVVLTVTVSAIYSIRIASLLTAYTLGFLETNKTQSNRIFRGGKRQCMS